MRSVNDPRLHLEQGVPSRGPFSPEPHSGAAMADVAFVITTIAVFALVAFVAKGVAKL
jgi:hypothetical protein